MGRLDQVREAVRRAYQVSRETLRAARERAQEPNGEIRELEMTAEPAGPAVPAVPAEPVAPAGSEPPRPVPVEEAVPRSLQIAAAWSWRLIVIAAVGWGLLWLADRFMLLVAPLMIGLLLAGLLMPAQRGLLKLRINRSIAALLVVVGGIAAVGGTLSLVVNEFIGGIPEVVEQVEEGIPQIEEWLQGGPLDFSRDEPEPTPAPGQPEPAEDEPPGVFDSLIETAREWVEANTAALANGVLAFFTGTVQFVTGMVMAIVVLFFFLRDGGRIWRFLVGLLPPAARAPLAYAGDGAWRSLSGYVRATVLVALVDAVGIGLGLQILYWTMDMQFVLPLAALVFLGGFVPIVGAFVSGTVAVVVALVLGPDLSTGLVRALIVLGIVIVVQQVESNVLQPFIVSKMVRIHPLAVIIAVLAGILLAGIFGALVAVPIVAVLNTVVRRLAHYHRHRLHLVAEESATGPPVPDPPPAGR